MTASGPVAGLARVLDIVHRPDLVRVVEDHDVDEVHADTGESKANLDERPSVELGGDAHVMERLPGLDDEPVGATAAFGQPDPPRNQEMVWICRPAADVVSGAAPGTTTECAGLVEVPDVGPGLPRDRSLPAGPLDQFVG